MVSIIKQARVRHTFGGEDASGWLPPNASQPPRTSEHTVDLVVQIERTDGGFILQWTGPTPEYSGDNWYMELPDAEQAADELFGISSDRWEPAA